MAATCARAWLQASTKDMSCAATELLTCCSHSQELGCSHMTCFASLLQAHILLLASHLVKYITCWCMLVASHYCPRLFTTVPAYSIALLSRPVPSHTHIIPLKRHTTSAYDRFKDMAGSVAAV